ncbi:MAG: type II toxin-antitoxin system HipA family toxin [Acidithiobacillus caldus]|uniref:type II toxin-antitoxin system HipA family toxin n=1 Tax=Acidithiobacillus caldus TaxID=33059 RepID=UPI002815EFF2|nr:type II toxin-antitoxin system HipA family toxin [Acidithiobacillus caldus]WMT47857.1 MAG: type II toxin-antitoxin system HipA family toxin [Acidithiobacillus caldus]
MKTKIKRLIVSTPQGQSGFLDKESQFVFNYDRGIDPSCEVSLNMPLRAQSYSANALLPIFSMNRPEGWLAYHLMQRLAKLGAVDDMALLAITGQHQIGRLAFRDQEALSGRKRDPIGLKEILSSPSREVFAFLVDQYFDSGVSGVQPKVLVPDADRSRVTANTANLIVKSGGEEYPELAVNEFLCLTVARQAGLLVPNFWLSSDRQLLVVERFDLDARGERKGFEDMAVLMGKTADATGNYKYQGSYEQVAKAIKYFGRENSSRNLEEFFSSVALSVLVRNGDAHLKNFGLIYDHPHGETPRLAPVYDVVTTTVYSDIDRRTGREVVDRTMALKFSNQKLFPDRKMLMDFGTKVCGVTHPQNTIERIQETKEHTARTHFDLLSEKMRHKMLEEWNIGRHKKPLERRMPFGKSPKQDLEIE